MKQAKFTEANDSTFERRIYERSFSGPLTKKRYKQIDRICRKNTVQHNCSCEHDCCGHLVNQRMTFEYKQNQVVITLIRIFNY